MVHRMTRHKTNFPQYKGNILNIISHTRNKKLILEIEEMHFLLLVGLKSALKIEFIVQENMCSSPLQPVTSIITMHKQNKTNTLGPKAATNHCSFYCYETNLCILYIHYLFPYYVEGVKHYDITFQFVNLKGTWCSLQYGSTYVDLTVMPS